MQRSALVFRLQVQKNLDTITQKSGKTAEGEDFHLHTRRRREGFTVGV